MSDVTVSVGVESKGVAAGEKQIIRSLQSIRKEVVKTRVQGFDKFDKTLGTLISTLDTTNRRIDKLSRTANKSSVAVTKATKQTSKYSNTLLGLQKSSRLVDGALGGVAVRFETLNSIVKTGGVNMLGFVAALAVAGLTITTLVKRGEQFQQLSNKLRLVTSSSTNLAVIQEELFQISQKTRNSLAGTIDVYARFARATKNLDVSQGKLLKVTTAINQAVTISGTTAASAAAALFQLGQGIAANALRGQELNSILEQTPRIAIAIAEGLGKNIGELRAFAAEGKLTAEVTLNALASQADILENEFNNTIITVSQSLTKLNNQITQTFGTLDKGAGITTTLANALSFLSDNLENVLGFLLKVAAFGAAFVIFKTAAKLIFGLTAAFKEVSLGATAFTLTTTSMVTGVGLVTTRVGVLTAATTALRVAFAALNPLTLVITLASLATVFLDIGFGADKAQEQASRLAKAQEEAKLAVDRLNNASENQVKVLTKLANAKIKVIEIENRRSVDLATDQLFQKNLEVRELQTQLLSAQKLLTDAESQPVDRFRANRKGAIGRVEGSRRLVDALEKALLDSQDAARGAESELKKLMLRQEIYAEQLDGLVNAINGSEQQTLKFTEAQKSLDKITGRLTTKSEKLRKELELLTSIKIAAASRGGGITDQKQLKQADDAIGKIKKTIFETSKLSKEINKLQKKVSKGLLPKQVFDNTLDNLAKFKATFIAENKSLTEAQEELLDTALANAQTIFEDATKKLQDAKNKADRLARESADRNNPLTKVLEQSTSNIQAAFKDMFKDIFDDGAISFKSLADRIKSLFVNMLADMAVLAIAKPIIVPVVQSLGGLLGTPQGSINKIVEGFGGEATTSGGGGIGDIFSSVGSFFGKGGGFGFNEGVANAVDGVFAAPGFAGATVPTSLGTAAGNAFSGAGLAGSFIGNFGANALLGGDRGLGANLGGAVGGGLAAGFGGLALATLLGVSGPIGILLAGLLGSFGGNAIGGLFGNTDPSSKEQNALVNLDTGNIFDRKGLQGDKFSQGNFDLVTNFSNLAAGIANSLTKGKGLEEILQVKVSDRAGFNFTFGGEDPTKQQQFETPELFVEGLVTGIANEFEGLSENLKIAIPNIDFTDIEEGLADLDFALAFDNLSFVPEKIGAMEQALISLGEATEIASDKAKELGLDSSVIFDLSAEAFNDLLTSFDPVPEKISVVEQAMIDLGDTFDALSDRATEFGSTEEKVAEARERAVGRIRTDFDTQVGDKILSKTNPQALALKKLNAQFKKDIADALAIGGDLLQLEELFWLERGDILRQGVKEFETSFAALDKTLANTLDGIGGIRDKLRLDTSLSGLNRKTKLDEAARQFNVVSARIAGGDTEAIKDLDATSNAFLQASLDYYGQTAPHLERLEKVFTLLDSAESLAKTTVSIEQLQLTEAFTTNELLEQLVASGNIAFNTSQNIQSLLGGIDQNKLLRPGEKADVLGETNLLNNLSRGNVRGLKVLSSSGQFDFSQDPSTFANFVQGGQKSAGVEFLRLLEQFGVSQSNIDKQSSIFGFASGTGNSTFSGLAVVGENGPELINFGKPAQIVNNGDTNGLASLGELAEDFHKFRTQSAQETSFLGARIADMTAIMSDMADELSFASRAKDIN